jgi:hypothetical protein
VASDTREKFTTTMEMNGKDYRKISGKKNKKFDE